MRKDKMSVESNNQFYQDSQNAQELEIQKLIDEFPGRCDLSAKNALRLFQPKAKVFQPQ